MDCKRAFTTAAMLARQLNNNCCKGISRSLSSSSQKFPVTGTLSLTPSSTLISKTLSRGVKTTSTIHPQPIHKDDEQVLDKVLKERENCEDLPESMMANPYEKTKKKCILCEHGIEPNYKNTRLLYQFVSSYTGNVYGRHITGLCKDKQAKVEHQINLAVNFAWMSNFVKDPEFLKDPKLCDPERPVRAHRY